MSRTLIVVTLCVCVAGVAAGFLLPLDEITRQPAPASQEQAAAPLVLPTGKPPRKAKVVALLQEARYDELEEHYRLTLAADRQSASDDLARFAAFGFADPDLRPALDGWIAEHDASAVALIARGQYHLHLAHIVRGEKFSSEISTTQFREMRRLLALAEADFERAIEVGPPSVAAYEGLIVIAITGGVRDASRDVLDRALAATDNALPLHLAFMRSLAPQWGGSSGAQLDYWTELRRTGSLRNAARYLDFVGVILQAEAACRVNDCAGGVAKYEEALRLIPERRGYVGHARALAALDRYEEALDVLDAGLQIEPESPEHHELKSIILATMERDEEARTSISEALKLDPYDPDLLIWSKYVLNKLEAQKRKSGDTPGAEAFAEQAYREIEKAMVYGAFRSEVQLARGQTLLLQGGDRSQAYAAFREAIELTPQDPKFILHYGNALAAAEDCEALPVYRRFEQACTKDGSCGRYANMNILTSWLEQQCDKSDEARRSRMVPSILAEMESCKADYETLAADAALARCTEKARSGDSAAAFDLALILTTGYGVDFDDRQAVHWLEVAAAQGHLKAKTALGTYIYQGVGTEKNAKRGMSMIREAANAGDTMGMLTLGLLYHQGMNGDRDLQESRRWLEQAANHGSKEARSALDRLFGEKATGQ